MNPGSGPEQDDTGLPPVDIEIPDDARELDRDVQAYHREQRAWRRQMRSARIHRRLSRDSMVMPLLICCLVFALISGTLLTLFTATSIDQSGLPGSGSGPGSAKPTTRPAASGVSPATRSAPPLVATAPVSVAGRTRKVNSLQPAILLVVPASGCACRAAISLLATLGRANRVTTYLVAAPSDVAQSQTVARQIGQGLQTAADTSGVLDNRGYPHPGLTAILVGPHGDVSYAGPLQASSGLRALVGRV